MASRPSPEHVDAVTRRLQRLAERRPAPETAAGRDRVTESPAPFPAAAAAPAAADGPGCDPDPSARAPRRPPQTDEAAAGDDSAGEDSAGQDAAAACPGPGATALPEPGRHAARPGGPAGPAPERRVVERVQAVLPEQLRGRWSLGPAQVAVVALLAALGLAVTAWWLLRSDPDPVPVRDGAAVAPLVPVSGSTAPPQSSPSTAETAAAGSAAAGASGAADADPDDPGAATGEVVVHVAGKVRRPGIVSLPSGARVVDALHRAGGARKGVELTSLNLARVLTDGEQIVVGADRPRGGAPAPAPASEGTASGAGSGTISLNAADQAELEELPGVGPVTAQAILEWRAEHGGFRSVEELLEVSGIGEATLAEIAPHATP